MPSLRHRIHRLASHRLVPILLLLAANLLAGLLVFADYPESWDEGFRYEFASESLQAYTGAQAPKDDKGPFYVMAALVTALPIQALRPDLTPIQTWHFVHFLSFQLGVVSLYLISKRVMSTGAAFGTTLLFSTQPLLWGHAFINPKDIPFMAFFLCSVELGLRMAESLRNQSPRADGFEQPLTGKPGMVPLILQDWKDTSPRTRSILVGTGILFLFLLAILTLGASVVQSWIAGLVHRAYAANPGSPLGSLFASLAQNAQDIPAETYVQKALRWYPRGVAGLTLLSLGLSTGLALLAFSNVRKWLWTNQVKPYFPTVWGDLKNPTVLGAGAILGCTTSIRILGPAAGVLSAITLLQKKRWRALPTLTAYFAIAALVTYLTWPGLWGNPIRTLLGVFNQSSDYPWEGKVMFMGTDYPVAELPRSYLPVLLTLQFTEPAVILFLAGLLVVLYKSYRGTIDRSMVALSALWLFAPLGLAMLRQPTFYDNFRHFLFVVPPLFLFIGWGLEALLDQFRSVQPRLLVLILLVLPGIYWIILLHPYQYVYYNNFAGSLQGAFRQYEMDYWATSYGEAIDYLNEVAPADATVVVWNADHLVRPHARGDLKIKRYRKGDLDPAHPPDYAIISTRHDKDLTLFPDASQIFSIGRGGGTFAVIKQIE